jgi:alpha-ketoglutarate-dependent taurine dioxygenase
MQYRTHENGWTIIAEGDLRTATQDDVNQIARYVATNTLVVFKKQNLNLEDELRIIKMFKNPEEYYEATDNNYKHYHIKGTNGLITRVTGEKDEDGVEGIAGFAEEMAWHCNHPYRADRRPIVWLYGVKGTSGSRTSWNNNIMSYNDLDQHIKDRLAPLEMYMKGGLNNNADLDDENTGYVKTDYTPKLVHTNNAGKTGLFFPFLQIDSFKGMTKQETQQLINEFRDYTIQEKYCYHHDWDDGDLLISEQWLGIHKRWYFDKIENRLLHRAVFDFPDQDYTK